MTRDDFELSVIDLAARGVRLTIVNVATHVRLVPSKVEAFLDELAHEGRLEVELDEDEGVVFYRVRGLTPNPGQVALAPRYPLPRDHAPAPAAPVRRQKSTFVAAGLGLFLPGIGLIYAAPLSATLVVTLGTIVSVKMVAALPLIGGLLKSVALGLAAIVSALLGRLYARHYNAHGRRTHLELGAPSKAGLRHHLHSALS